MALETLGDKTNFCLIGRGNLYQVKLKIELSCFDVGCNLEVLTEPELLTQKDSNHCRKRDFNSRIPFSSLSV